MTQKERFDACMKQADFFSQKVYNRQSYQWKVTIGLWTVLLASTGFLFDRHVHHIPNLINWTIVAGYAFLWVRYVAISNRHDQVAANHFRDEAEALLRDETHSMKPRHTEHPVIRHARWWFQFAIVGAHLFEVLTTALIVFGANWLLSQNWPVIPK